jgi:hypothetical protein
MTSIQDQDQDQARCLILRRLKLDTAKTRNPKIVKKVKVTLCCMVILGVERVNLILLHGLKKTQRTVIMYGMLIETHHFQENGVSQRFMINVWKVSLSNLLLHYCDNVICSNSDLENEKAPSYMLAEKDIIEVRKRRGYIYKSLVSDLLGCKGYKVVYISCVL